MVNILQTLNNIGMYILRDLQNTTLKSRKQAYNVNSY